MQTHISYMKMHVSIEYLLKCYFTLMSLILHFSAVSSLAYEKVCVLFNIGALQSSVAAAQSIENDDGLKLAAKMFQVLKLIDIFTE